MELRLSCHFNANHKDSKPQRSSTNIIGTILTMTLVAILPANCVIRPSGDAIFERPLRGRLKKNLAKSESRHGCPPSISSLQQNDPPQSPHFAKMTPLNLLTLQNDPPQSPHLLKNLLPKSVPKSPPLPVIGLLT